MTLRERMKNGPVFGITCFTGSACVVETIGNYGYDFVYLDLEHCPLDGPNNMEKLIMAAKLAGIPSVVRVTGTNEVEIRKVLEMGAEGVVVPHTRTVEDVKEILKGAKFPPMGRRGGESCVRSANFGGPGFSWSQYIQQSNEDTLVIPMDEDFEFTDNLDEILDVSGIDAVNFGPIDYALSIGAKVGYATEDARVADAYQKLVQGCAKRGIGVMCPVVPATRESIEAAIEKGITMLILGNDMYHLGSALKTIKQQGIDAYRLSKN
jgi:4-hydroxy-2-oxoheptanedioate aldolase